MTGTRCSGVLLHVTSLPGGPLSGDLGPSAYRFVNFLAEAGQTRWQTLPLNPVGDAGSPYSSASSFAGEPLLISPEGLVEDGLLDATRLDGVPLSSSDWRLRFSESKRLRRGLLEEAHRAFLAKKPSEMMEEFSEFRAREWSWLEDYCLFGALSKRYGTCEWNRWPRGIAQREEDPLHAARLDLRSHFEYVAFTQFLFDRQWRSLQRHCRECGIEIIGDLPMFVALDSCDVWADQRGFLLDSRGRPEFVSGAPPDAFSADGQRWNNPLYDWAHHGQTGFAWWTRRIERQLSLFDWLRLDHFIGFSRYWRIRCDADSAKDGEWVPAPGRALFDELSRRHGDLPLIAEDLGAVTQEVWDLRDRYGFPGMKVLQFAFSDERSAAVHLPEHYPRASAAFTGTHDSDTTRGWYDTLLRRQDQGDAGAGAELARVQEWLGTCEVSEVVPRAMQLLSESLADTVIFPMQDVLNLDGTHRMNAPGTTQGNWTWRLKAGQLDEALSDRLRDLSQASGRHPAR